MQAIKLDGITRKFGDFTAVDDVNLEIEEGEFFSLLGPSGCGKTTTLRMLAGFDVPTTGSILLEGEPVEKVPPNKRNVNMVFQNYALFDHLDVKGNVAFGLKRKRVKPDEIRRRVAESLELVDLSSRADARPSQLSGGQRQRVALARALVNKPGVLLLDEPLGALDLKLRRQMQVELKQIQREVGITFVYVTHDQEEALSMSDRIAVMSEGRVVQCGPPEEIYEHPKEEFVAGFIGISNLLSGTAEGRGQVRVGGICLPVPDLPDSYGAGDQVQIAVRPEKIAVDEVDSEAGPIEADMFTVEGEVESMVYLGVGNQLTLKLEGGGRLVALEQATYRMRSDDRWKVGQKVRLGWHAEHCMVLSSDGTPA
jgi:spermidine/putrescine transport system ATP-binding protein